MAIRMDNVGIVVTDLERAVQFFQDLGLTLEGRAMMDGEWAELSFPASSNRRSSKITVMPRSTPSVIFG